MIEPRSNTMRLGAHRERLPECTRDADQVLWYQPPGVDWDLESVARESATPSRVFQSTDAIIGALVAELQPGDQVVIMSNGGFEGVHRRLLQALESAVPSRAG